MEYNEFFYIFIATCAAIVISRLHKTEDTGLSLIRNGARSRERRHRSSKYHRSPSAVRSSSESPNPKSSRRTSIHRYSPYSPQRHGDETVNKCRKRLNIAKEILLSERAYSQALDVIHEKVYVPLRDVSNRPNFEDRWITKRSLNAIFSNFQDIRSISKELLRQLEDRLTTTNGKQTAVEYDQQDADTGNMESTINVKHWNPANGLIADIFLNLYPFFKMYAVYVKNFSLSLDTLTQKSATNDMLRTFLHKALANTSLNALGLSAYLIMPVQRIPRYRLLLQDLLDNTSCDHPDYSFIVCALEKMESVADFVNEQIRVHENALKLYDIQQRMIGYIDSWGRETSLMQPGRKLLKEGRLMKVTKKDFQPRVVFLLNDILVYAIARKSFNLFSLAETKEDSFLFGNEFIFRHNFYLAETRIINLPDDTKGGQFEEKISSITFVAGIPYSFLVYSNEKAIQLIAANEEEKMEWLRLIQTAINDCRMSQETRNQCLLGRSARSDSIQSVNESLVDLNTEKELNDFIPPIWLPDEVTSTCMVCNERFTLLRRKHHCRLCGSVICHYCSTKTVKLPFKGILVASRACDVCYFERFKNEVKIRSRSMCVNVRSRSSSSRALSAVVVDNDVKPTQNMPCASSEHTKSLNKSAEILRLLISNNAVVKKSDENVGLLIRPSKRSASVCMESEVRSRSKTEFAVGKASLKSTRSLLSHIKQCGACQLAFGLARWKYECSKCFNVVCGSCIRVVSSSDQRFSKGVSNKGVDISNHHVCQLCFFGIDTDEKLPLPVGTVLSVSRKITNGRSGQESRMSHLF